MEGDELEKKIEELKRKHTLRRHGYDENPARVLDIEAALTEAILFGQERMKARAISCVPEEYLAFHPHYGLGYNRCREKLLSELKNLKV